MTLPADIAHIEKLHQLAEVNGDTSFEHHMRATLLRAYRELAQERDEWRRLQHKAGRALESRIQECDRLRGDFQFQQNKADSVVTLNLALEAERDRLQARVQELEEQLRDRA